MRGQQAALERPCFPKFNKISGDQFILRNELLFRRLQARQQALEVARILERQVQPPRELALGGAGRPDEQRVLAGQGSEQSKPHLPAALDEATFELIEER